MGERLFFAPFCRFQNSKIGLFLFFINPIKKVGLTFIRIVLKF
ncbi:hypothetical protein CHCC20375_0408 [Bacillus licheniformis]|nr:hypothetical protein CHCC20375_0408 [Bacillus licheniformis]